MARFVSTVEVRATPEQVFARLTDWPAHERWVPLTRMTVLTDRPGGVGARFVARSYAGLPALGFDDPMEITEWDPPVPGGNRHGRCGLVKQGRLVRGKALLEVYPSQSGGSVASWAEEIEIAPVRLTRPFGRLVSVAGRAGFGRALKLMGRELERELGVTR